MVRHFGKLSAGKLTNRSGNTSAWFDTSASSVQASSPTVQRKRFPVYLFLEIA
jgi:hypothetical protein